MTAHLTALLLNLWVGISPAPAAYPSRMAGPFLSATQCEVRKAQLSREDRESLLDRFPQFFLSSSEVTSFLLKALACERLTSDGRWYLVDHRLEVLNSEWFESRFR